MSQTSSAQRVPSELGAWAGCLDTAPPATPVLSSNLLLHIPGHTHGEAILSHHCEPEDGQSQPSPPGLLREVPKGFVVEPGIQVKSKNCLIAAFDLLVLTSPGENFLTQLLVAKSRPQGLLRSKPT